MRYIQKASPPPQGFINLLGRCTNYRQFRRKKELKALLIEEQRSLCGYCESRVELHISHNEHIVPQSKDTNRTLDYYNLIASCGKERTNTTDESCGHRRYDWYDEALFIHPLCEDCSRHFSFAIDGEITGLTEEGKTTIDKLNLNTRLLKNSRKRSIAGVLDGDYSLQQLERILYHTDKGLPEFISFREWYIQELSNQV
jgi:uncharacterized protein (TIGR02646 family)